MSKQLMIYDQNNTTRRKCGDCVGCCLAPTLMVEPHKPLGQKCTEVRDGRKKGCGIYETRPKGCKDYECHWLCNNFLERQHRPDKIGVIFDDGETRRMLTGLRNQMLSSYDWRLPPVTAREIWSGAFERQKSLLNEIAKITVLILVRPNGSGATTIHVIGPHADAVRAVEEALRG